VLLGLPVGPGADLVPDVGAGALGGADLPMSVQDVSGNDLAATDRIGEQTLGSGDLSRGEGVGIVVAQEGDADRLGVPVSGVSTHNVPAATLVHVAVSADQEVVADIGPAQGVHVVGLDVLQLCDAGGLGAAVVSSGVVDHGVAQVVGQRGLARGGTAAPLRLGDDGHAENGLGAEEYGQKDESFVCHGCGSIVRPVVRSDLLYSERPSLSPASRCVRFGLRSGSCASI